jgi:hypothetical protein
MLAIQNISITNVISVTSMFVITDVTLSLFFATVSY